MKKLLFIILILFSFANCSKKDKETSIFEFESTVSQGKEENKSELEQIKPVPREKKFKIAVIQSDDYYEYFEAFTAIYGSLESLGWVKESDILKKNHTMNDKFIEDLKNYDYSDYISFEPELFYSFKADDTNVKDVKFQNLAKKIKNKEVDLVILLGTMASQIVLNLPDYNIPTLVDAVTDPVGSGIIASQEDSGKDFLTGRIDTEQYARQARLFYDVVKFKKLGLIYENSENGRAYAAVDYVEKVKKEKGFEIIENHNALAEPSENELSKAYGMYLKALDTVCPQSDAIFLGVSGGLEDQNMPKVVEKLIKYRVPSFTMEGSYMVKKGAMLGVSGKETGLYNAKKIAMILNGTSPRTLSQKYEKTPRISINLKMAELIAYDIPVEIIKSADEIFLTIEGVD